MENKINKKAIKKEIIEWAFCFIIAYVIYLFINFFIGTVSSVKQVSMIPTANEGEKVIIQRTIFNKKVLKYGDIITFSAPDVVANNTLKANSIETLKDEKAIANYVKRNSFEDFIYDFMGIGKKSYIKRVIGLSGDHIVVKSDGLVYRNDIALIEKYLNDGTTSQSGSYIDVIVPDNTVFVMGDNRLQSMDSRSFGSIPMSKVEGYVIYRIWPFNKVGNLI